jgi:pyruvate dehydrogenase E2 component (dihydrolipoamide acetyltransferase)
MATEIIMPKVDMVMETGTFVEWLKQEGASIQKGEALFVIMTDKAAIEVEAPAGGILAGLTAKPDDVIPVSEVIGYILQPGESLPKAVRPLQPSEEAVDEKATPGGGGADKEWVDISQLTEKKSGEKLVRATPSARNLAREMKLDLRLISGSGPRGRIYRGDVERYLQALPIGKTETRPEAVQVGDSELPPPDSAQRVHISLPVARERGRIALKGPRAVIAQRMAYSAATVPHIHLAIQVDMTEATRWREKVNPIFERRIGHRVSVTALIAHAVVYLLPRHPTMNSSLLKDEIILWEDVHLGIATDLGEYLVVPVIREAQGKSLEEMVLELNRLVERAHAKKLLPSEMSGSTFTISNLGRMGVDSFTAIVNPPETGILAVGKLKDMPVAIEKEMVIRPMVTLTLAVDHRVVDGAQAANFLSDLKEVLENPYLLI